MSNSKKKTIKDYYLEVNKDKADTRALEDEFKNLNAKDYALHNNAYQQYLQTEDLNTQKRQAEDTAYQQYVLLNKYLPTQLRQSGINNTGLGESAVLQSNNNYQNTVAKINSNIASEKQTINSDYATRQADLLQQYEALERENQANEEIKKETKSSNVTSTLSARIGNLLNQYQEDGNFTTSEKTQLDDLLSQYRAELTDTDYESLKAQYIDTPTLSDQYKEYETNVDVENDIVSNKAINDKLASATVGSLATRKNNGIDTDSTKDGGATDVTVDGKKYYVSFGKSADATTSKVLSSMGLVNNKQYMYYNNALWYKDAEGKIVQIVRRKRSHQDNATDGYYALLKVIGAV